MHKELDQMTPDELGKLFPIFLTKPDAAWPAIYQEEKAQIEAAFLPDSLAGIQHIGSTAIPGLIAKPTIDVLLEVKPGTGEQHIIETLTEIGYHYIHKPENPAPHMLFVKGYTREGFKGQAFHVHVRYPGDWDEPRFRDYLIAHPESCGEYARLKEKLAAKFRNDRDGYTDAKEVFVKQINRLARNKKP